MLTCEPLLHFLGIDDLLKIRQLNKASRDDVDSHLKTKKKYTTSLVYGVEDRKTIRVLPSLSHLTLQLPVWYNEATLKDYVNPNLQSLTLVLHGQFDIEYGLFAPRRLLVQNYRRTLEYLHDMLMANELPLLHEIHVQLADVTEVGEDITLTSVEDYDDDGPIYENAFITNLTDAYDPIHYWILACDYSTYGEDLAQKWIDVLTANTNKWTKISYPYDFFGAAEVETLFPQTRTTNWLTEGPKTIQEHIDAVLLEEAIKDNICSRNGYYKCSSCRALAEEQAAADATAAASPGSDAQSSTEHA